jgi:hypothetical protein
MVQNTERQTVGLISAVPAHQVRGEDLTGLVERSVVKIDNAEILADQFGPLGFTRQLHGKSTERSVFLIGRLDARLHDVVEVVVAQLGRSGRRVVGLGHGVVVRLRSLRLGLLGLVVLVINDGGIGVGGAIIAIR